MRRPPSVSDVRFVASSERDQRIGLLGYASFLLHGDIRIDGVAVRQTLDRRLVLSYPAKSSRGGVQHPYVLPINKPAREAIERAVFQAIGLGEGRLP